jgi:hypothetical protein
MSFNNHCFVLYVFDPAMNAGDSLFTYHLQYAGFVTSAIVTWTIKILIGAFRAALPRGRITRHSTAGNI